MRKIFASLFVVGALYMVSCNVTDLQPKNALASSTIFSDSSNIELAVVGVYHSTQTQLFGYNGGGDPRGYPFGAAHVEQGEMRGEDLVNTQGFFSIVYANTQTSSSPNCVNQWAGLFEVINQANTAIDGLSSTKAISSSRAAGFIGEMMFLRAMAYHELLVYYARPYGDNPTTNLGVPYRTTPSQKGVDAATAVPRNTVDECYTKIIADLDFAEANLPSTRGDQLQVTRATKGAAIALKTRVYQHMNNWAKVISEAAKIVSSPASPTSPIGSYALNANPAAAFSNPTTAESVFSIEYSSVNQGSVNGGLGSCFLPNEQGGRGLIGVSPNLYNQTFWTATDSRRTSYVIIGSLSDGKSVPYINKFKDAVTNTDYTPLIRYPEVLLNYSEALARTGDLPNSLLLLNAVRDRAVLAADKYTALSFPTQNAQIQAILNERRIEFIGEGRRWPDIHRLSTDPTFNAGGIPAKLLYSQYKAVNFVPASGTMIAGSVTALPYSDYHFLYPISNVEIANNPTLAAQQNPGY
jgi:hypothetical protein